jgi:transcriptional regulator with XRE-family HTH domain
MATIGDRIRNRRLELGLSLRDVSQTGLSPGYVSRVERGERQASGKALRGLASSLEVSVHWLETGREDPAETLAQLVLEHRGKPLPSRATTLARQVLNGQRL